MANPPPSSEGGITPGATYSFTYGDFGLRTGVSVGQQSLASYSYTTDGYNRLDTLDYGNGDSVKYSYSSKDGSLTKQTYEDGKKVTYTYNIDGTLAAVSDGLTGRTTRYYYDFTERLSKITESGTNHSFTKTYTYDSSNRLTSATEKLNGNSRKITFTYDGDNRIATYKKGNISQTYTYDGFGRNSKKVVKNGDSTLLTTTHTFRTVNGNATGQISGLRNKAASYDVTYTYTYDGNGNILTVSDGTQTISYAYDESNQLVRENHQREQDSYTYVWVYDTAGNILSRTKYAYTTGELGTPTETVNYTYGNSGWKDQLTAFGDRTFTYDEIGNPLTDGKRTYTWQHGRQLATLTQGETTWTNTYNADGLRIKRTDGTNTYQYTYSDGKLINMTYGADTLYFSYAPDGLPYNVEYNGTQYVYALNQQGDVMAILNTAGQAVVKYTYDAWGNILDVIGSTTLGNLNPLRYRGYVYDNETQLYYLQSRYYDPEIGRFINADDIDLLGANGDFASLNLYVYCGNNPVVRKDSNGEAWQVALASGGLVAAGVSWSSLGATVLAALGAITPVGWIAIGTVAVAGVVVASVAYAKGKSKGRSVKKPGLRKKYNSKKKAYEAAKKAGGGKEPIKHPKNSHGRNDPHFHPRTRNEYSKTPKMPSMHDHYYYPR